MSKPTLETAEFLGLVWTWGSKEVGYRIRDGQCEYCLLTPNGRVPARPAWCKPEPHEKHRALEVLQDFDSRYPPEWARDEP